MPGSSDPIEAMNMKKPIIVTAYHKEKRAILERCLASVQKQTLAADHVLIADGHPQSWIDLLPVRHIKLDRPHGDYGNTPRNLTISPAAPTPRRRIRRRTS
jgi:hypothetical protein